LEGSYKFALEGIMECHKMNPTMRLWNEIIPLTVSILNELN